MSKVDFPTRRPLSEAPSAKLQVENSGRIRLGSWPADVGVFDEDGCAERAALDAGGAGGWRDWIEAGNAGAVKVVSTAADRDRLTFLCQIIPRTRSAEGAELHGRLKSAQTRHNKARSLLPAARTYLALTKP